MKYQGVDSIVKKVSKAGITTYCYLPAAACCLLLLK